MQELFEALHQRGIMLATAESCTGGMIAKTITDLPGSSEIFDRGFVTYSNESKAELLAVPEAMLAEYGAVSAQVAQAMAEGALNHSNAKIAVSCTGIAGPGGGSAEKPVGLVYIGIASVMGGPRTFEHHFQGNRDTIRTRTVEAALKHLLETLQ